jgi:hypothetical protein
MISAMLTTIVLVVASEVAAMPAWHMSYPQALADAARADKPLFIVFGDGSQFVTRFLNREPYQSDAVERALSADYVRMFVDTSTESGRALEAEFGARDPSRLVVLDRSGRWQVYRRSGNHTSDQVLAVLAEYRTARVVRAEPVRPVSVYRAWGEGMPTIPCST